MQQQLVDLALCCTASSDSPAVEHTRLQTARCKSSGHAAEDKSHLSQSLPDPRQAQDCGEEAFEQGS